MQTSSYVISHKSLPKPIKIGDSSKTIANNNIVLRQNYQKHLM
jgi:hypothetical protein